MKSGYWPQMSHTTMLVLVIQVNPMVCGISLGGVGVGVEWGVEWSECARHAEIGAGTMAMSRSNKMLQYLNWRVRVTIQDNRYLIGTFIAFDKHMNIILSETEEFRTIVPKGARGASAKAKKKAKESKIHKRVLGFVLLRGETVISMTPETPPAPQPRVVAPAAQGGPGVGRAVGRGLPPFAMRPGPPQGLSAPVAGIGGPSGPRMMPRGGPMPFGRAGIPPPPGAFGRGRGRVPPPPPP